MRSRTAKRFVWALAILAVALLAAASPAFSQPIEYTFSGTLSGAVGAATLTNAAVDIVAIGDVSTVSSGGGVFCDNVSSVTIYDPSPVTLVGTFSVFDNQNFGNAGIREGACGASGFDWFRVSSSQFNTYNLGGPLAPLTVTPSFTDTSDSLSSTAGAVKLTGQALTTFSAFLQPVGLPVVPSVELTGVAASSCDSTTGFAISLEVNLPGSSSANIDVTVAGVGPVASAVVNASHSVGSENLTVKAPNVSAYSAPANTPITVTVTTYNGPNATGGASFVSTLVFNCTTGSVISLQSGPPGQVAAVPVPALSAGALAVLGVALAFAGLIALRR